MRHIIGGLTVALVVVGAAAGILRAQADPPSWAYPVTEATGAPAPAPPHDEGLERVPGSSQRFTYEQIHDRYNAVDWHPDDHPPMPQVVAHGREPAFIACAYCHLTSGVGHAVNASVAGLPAAYIVQQMNDFKNDLRKSWEPRLRAQAMMIAIAKAATDAEIKEAAAYFSSLTPKPNVKVVESATVPTLKANAYHHGTFMPAEGGGREPIGQRIIEMAEGETDGITMATRFDRNDSRETTVAYVPVGSLKKGQALVTTGQCAMCHGPTLTGLGPVPSIAGRSPGYIARQLYDMQQGTRKGLWSDLMKPAVANLSDEDMLNIAAYTSSLNP